MRISSKGNYGLRAAYELACNYGEGPIAAKQISQHQSIPLQVLEQLLFLLYNNGLIKIEDGPFGLGYMLSDEPDRLSVGDIFRALEGPVQIAGCVNSGEKEHCHREKFCFSLIFWKMFEKKMEHLLDGYSLGDLSRLA
ncbi:MAG: Rrf2 family transcriptional regulator [Deltaproteobacteria bacterium]|uniref:RrF2 family transcriptional regulator n=1 Tax=Desulfobacula sp. TaxID=2593537 RepID=UPI00198FB420|nr:Rrf2 family transcriptional regulator [Candidatus Desulfobacula maris]MBL6992994.1 Rrf2 family transcriptional regulator [Desulfobacula sp.]